MEDVRTSSINYYFFVFLKGQTSLLLVFQVYKETIKSSGDLERSFFCNVRIASDHFL